MDRKTLLTMFGAYCAVSGSPVRSNDYNRYKLTLPMVNSALGETHTGYMHYCCWRTYCFHDLFHIKILILSHEFPLVYKYAQACVCDTQDFIKWVLFHLFTSPSMSCFYYYWKDIKMTLRVDTKTIVHAGGAEKYHVAVIGNPCDDEVEDSPFFTTSVSSVLFWMAFSARLRES